MMSCDTQQKCGASAERLQTRLFAGPMRGCFSPATCPGTTAGRRRTCVVTAAASRGKPPPAANTTKGTCDRCCGEGVLPCPDCAGSSQPGVREERPFGWLGAVFGVPVSSTSPCTCKPRGFVVCWRCKGKKQLVYRSADWR